jgi:Spy/CpxP family protein refolding chaperone
MLKKTFALSLVLTVTLFWGLAHAGHRHFGGPGGEHWGMMPPECAKEIGLEEAQIDKIKSIHLNSQKEIIKLRAEVGIAQLELKEMMTSDNPDKSRINKKIDEISALRAKIRKIEAGSRIDVQSVLTSEQEQLLKEWRMKRAKEKSRGYRCFEDRGGRGSSMGREMMPGRPGWRYRLPPPPDAPPPAELND